MMPILFSLLALIPFESGQPADTVSEIDALMSRLHDQGDFNGSILVARQGQVIYSKGFGKANFKTGQNFLPSTKSCIASVTKQFTAMSIMMLVAEGKIGYDDPVTKHLGKLPSCYEDVSIRHLLTHTSGVFDYDNIGKGRPDQLITRKRSLQFQPGQKYEYSNSNYVLLSMVIEKVTGKSFPDFLQQQIFSPLDMTSTFTYADRGKKPIPFATGYNQFGKENDYKSTVFFGDGGLYSTVEDLFKWHRALYTDQLVKPTVLAEAFVPGRVKEGSTTYGFGWNISSDDYGKYAWHTGNTAGFRAYIQHRLDDEIAIIMLTNTGPTRRIEIAAAINHILHGEPYDRIKRSGAKKMYNTITQQGIDSAVQFYRSIMHGNDQPDYDVSETEFNLLGYELLGENKIDAAITIFKLNTETFPSSSNAFDSLGEAYLKKGDSKSARESYGKALQIDPNNVNAANMLKKIK
jgi:CubicO group peptidase (beta-lactamase class C family)